MSGVKPHCNAVKSDCTQYNLGVVFRVVIYNFVVLGATNGFVKPHDFRIFTTFFRVSGTQL